MIDGRFAFQSRLVRRAECLRGCGQDDTRLPATWGHLGEALAPCAMAVGGERGRSLGDGAMRYGRAPGPNSGVVEAWQALVEA
jgi:hypothetical protein